MASDKISDVTYDEILSAWAKLDSFEPQRKGEITAREYSLLIGRNVNTALKILKDYVQARVWASRSTLVKGRRTAVFWPMAKPDICRDGGTPSGEEIFPAPERSKNVRTE